jgi:PIN domain nuclease of toxin-antitoxin system
VAWAAPISRSIRASCGEGYHELPILSEQVVAIGDLPLLHKDPFDRLLIAQARVAGITLLTADARVAQYPGPVRRV